jgi:subfamily B ATP-binding cassette protein HlyB/CyaB
MKFLLIVISVPESEANLIQTLLKANPLLSGIPSAGLQELTGRGSKEISLSPGEDVIIRRDETTHLLLISKGTARLLGGSDANPVPLELLKEGSLIGLESFVCGKSIEWVRASSSLKLFLISLESFSDLLRKHPDVLFQLQSRIGIAELFPLIESLLKQRGLPISSSKSLAHDLLPHARLLVEKEGSFAEEDSSAFVILESVGNRRITLPHSELECLLGGLLPTTPHDHPAESNSENISSPSPPSLPISPREDSMPAIFGGSHPAFCKASSPQHAVMACLRMLAGQLDLPFREEVVRSALKFQLEGRALSFPRIGSVADMIGIATQPLQLPADHLVDQDPPFLMILGESLVVVQEVNHHGLLIANPLKAQEWIEWKDLPLPPGDGSQGHVILLTRRSRTPKGEAFGFGSFIPYIKKHTRTFIEVIIASMLIQVFALANPLITQIIIDKVIVQESLSTLDILAALLIITTIFSAALTAIRTFLFTDATNRIDLSIGLKVLEHLYRLPLSYFHQRPVGEIASRLRELDTIRSFLTGTALTALLDASFSVIFVGVMLFYSVELTVIALVGVPLLVALTLFVSPIVRRQLKDKAEKNAATESHLVESLTGIQTIKGQNIETRSRWKWYKRYGDTISSSFRNTLTGTTASTIGMLINRFNDVAVLWVGVYLVIDQKMSLGQLIAFRIFAGYVTSPLLRLAQSWQSFQQAALSVNRLGDVANRAREDQESDVQIPMPEIQGSVNCRDLDFGYAPGKLQLEHVSLDVPAGKLIAMVGLSGSGKSTLLKIIGRLYEPVAGKVEIDGFNLSKVELNSLRRQIGMVFQETLLLEGSVMDNIALSNPDASPDEIIAAAKMAEAHDFIMTLPNGYATPVGEQGRNLSGGQRQRIALARLILQSPNLLLLDEATSALDAPTELRVITNLRQRFAGKTIFFATHRLSTVRMADYIFYLQDGLLVEQGTHPELMDKQGLYYALMLQQEGGV